MPSAKDVMKELDIQLDKRLQDLQSKKLIEIAHTLLTSMDKKSLTSLLSDDKYFPLTNIVKWLEKKEKDTLLQILDEPASEIDLRRPIEAWLKQEEGIQKTDYEVPIPIGGRNRAIDVCGFRGGVGGFSSLGGKIVAVELKIKPNRGAIDKAFAQAKDNAKGANYSYVAFSPYVYLKYADVIMNKDKEYKEVGVLISDSRRVVMRVSTPDDYDVYDQDVYNSVKDYMDK